MNKKTLFEQFYEVARSDFKSDSQLAKSLGISRGTFGLYTKKNNPRSPNTSTLENWCKLLNIEIENNIFKKSVI